MKQLDKFTHSYTFWDFISSIATGGVISGIIFSLYMYSNYLKLDKLAFISKISLVSILYTGCLNSILKFMFNRERPSIGLNPWHFFAFFKSSKYNFANLMYAYNSMPSGHTITGFAAITPFYLAYKNKFWRSILIMWATMVAFSRVYTLNHWLSDVVLASILGLIFGTAIYRAYCE